MEVMISVRAPPHRCSACPRSPLVPLTAPRQEERALMTALASGAIAASSWNGHDTRLILAAVAGVAVLVVLIMQFKVHPFLALMLGTGTLGAVAGMSLSKIIDSFGNGL